MRLREGEQVATIAPVVGSDDEELPTPDELSTPDEMLMPPDGDPAA
jgi:hypothetical protein